MQKKHKMFARLAVLLTLLSVLAMTLSACSSDDDSSDSDDPDVVAKRVAKRLDKRYAALNKQPYITIKQANDIFAEAANYQNTNSDDFATLIDKMNNLRVVDEGSGKSYQMVVKDGDQSHAIRTSLNRKATYRLKPIYDNQGEKRIQIDPNWQKAHPDLAKENNKEKK